MPNPTSFWGKVRRSDPKDPTSEIVAWHPLADHSADVAACLEALLRLPGFLTRAEALLGSRLGEIQTSRLSLLAFLHDIGKGNAGFQSKVFPAAERHASAPRGHLAEAAEAGQLLPGLNLYAAQGLIIGALSWSNEWWDPERGNLQELIDNAQALVRNGIGR